MNRKSDLKDWQLLQAALERGRAESAARQKPTFDWAATSEDWLGVRSTDSAAQAEVATLEASKKPARR